jgi:hypothetical protein
MTRQGFGFAGFYFRQKSANATGASSNRIASAAKLTR